MRDTIAVLLPATDNRPNRAAEILRACARGTYQEGLATGHRCWSGAQYARSRADLIARANGQVGREMGAGCELFSAIIFRRHRWRRGLVLRLDAAVFVLTQDKFVPYRGKVR